MRSHEIDYELHGDDMQMVEVELDPQETVVAEAGSMNWMEEDINFEAKMGDGSEPDKGVFGKLLDVGKRVLTAESLFLVSLYQSRIHQAESHFCGPLPRKNYSH